MKNIIFLFISLSFFQSVHGQLSDVSGKLLITGGTEFNPLRITSTTLENWNSIDNSNGQIGYWGIFSNHFDMDFGTEFGNTNGRVHLVTETIPRLTVDSDGDVGIGTQTPDEKLHVDGNVKVDPGHDVLFGDSLAGAGARMMWLSAKEAFRAGLAQGVQWDMDSVGTRSAAFGGDNIAKGDNSMSWGFNNSSRGALSTSWGSGHMATGNNSTAWGSGSTTSGFAATAWGSNQTTSGNWSTAWGHTNVSSGQFCTVWGADNISFTENNNATTWGFGNMSGIDGEFTELTTAFGANNEVSGKLATVWGEFNKAQSFGETVVGRWADTVAAPNRLGWTASDQLFVVGNGTADNARNNALTVLKNGNLGVNKSNPNDALDVIGDIDATGCVQTDDAGSIGGTCISDIRYKENVVTLDNQLSKVLALNPVSFDWKDPNINGGQAGDIGLIAQEVEAVIPAMVKTGEDGYKRVRYDISLQMRMIKAVQEQHEIIKAQNDKISGQQTQINRQQREIDELKSLVQSIVDQK